MDSTAARVIKFIITLIGNIFIVLFYLVFLGVRNSDKILAQSDGLSGAGEPLDLLYGFAVIAALGISLLLSLIGGFIVLPRWVNAASSSNSAWSFLFVIVSFMISYLLLAPPINLATLVPRLAASLIGS